VEKERANISSCSKDGWWNRKENIEKNVMPAGIRKIHLS